MSGRSTSKRAWLSRSIGQFKTLPDPEPVESAFFLKDLIHLDYSEQDDAIHGWVPLNRPKDLDFIASIERDHIHLRTFQRPDGKGFARYARARLYFEGLPVYFPLYIKHQLPEYSQEGQDGPSEKQKRLKRGHIIQNYLKQCVESQTYSDNIEKALLCPYVVEGKRIVVVEILLR
ncbi:hypothetical protein P389DRAFT_95566 [Cystobasidium minutum MCA 4210]|uniref:uncharacterized protein n=1 Tax=Cystobasidium minutum MCA 4210 TaxID=1397322 RepID=UPI0034CD5333|eukprot:jgi/Rhomi1/95566/CE95565_1167